MDKTKILKHSFLHSVYVLLYVLAVVTLMSNSEKLFKDVNSEMLIGTAMLLLFVTSAAVVGGLVLAKPVMMYLDGNKKEALMMFVKTIMWLVMWLVVVFLVIAIV